MMLKSHVDTSHIPQELINAPQWVCWKYVMKTAGKTKIPYTPGGSAAAKTNDPKTWRDFDKAAASLRRYDGIGFVVTSDDPWCGVDIDHCIDKETGAIVSGEAPTAAQTTAFLASGLSMATLHGLHVLAERIGERVVDRIFEMCSAARIVEITGENLRQNTCK